MDKFLSTPSSQRATVTPLPDDMHVVFLSTPSSQRATSSGSSSTAGWADFYPRPLRRGRHAARRTRVARAENFYPRPLRRGRLQAYINQLRQQQISIHALFAEGDARPGLHCGAHGGISIHALFAEGDPPGRALFMCPNYFYPRPLRRGRLGRSAGKSRCNDFYPRPLRRGRHSPARCGTALRRNFYPRPLRRGRPHIRQFVRQLVHISIHALFAEGDRRILFEHCADGISIHALFAEGDRVRPCWSPSPSDFYPRPLRRGRPARDLRPGQHRTISIHALFAEGDDLNGLFDAGFYYTFLSTPSSQRATQTGSVHVQFRSTFLSTPSSQRATCSINATVYPPHYFYPRPLRRGRLSACAASALVSTFLSTPSSQRATGVCASAAVTVAISIHALFAEGDHPACAWCGRPSRDFYPRPLRRGRPSAPM